MKITKTWLEERDACKYQIAIFMTEWPNGVTVTEKVLLRAAELRLDLYWLADEVLRDQAWTAYCYTMDLAYNNLRRGKGQAWIEYKRIQASAIMAGLNKMSKE